MKKLYQQIKTDELPKIVKDLLDNNGALTIRICKEIDNKHIFLEILNIETNEELEIY